VSLHNDVGWSSGRGQRPPEGTLPDWFKIGPTPVSISILLSIYHRQVNCYSTSPPMVLWISGLLTKKAERTSVRASIGPLGVPIL
jgi:hypothetical protein